MPSDDDLNEIADFALSCRFKPPASSRLKTFGLSVADWWRALWWQNGKCAICAKRFTPKRRPQTDHNHATGEFRGLLCVFCNTELGFHHEDVDWFLNAWKYLTTPPARFIFTHPRIHVDAPPARH